MSRAIILVLDSLGIGSAPDASRYGDEGADTFGHIALACAESARGPLQIPNLTRLGLPQAHAAHRGAPAAGFAELPAATALFGFASERSVGKDTPSGHWEMAGVPVMTEWGMFLDREHSFPDSLLAELIREAALPGVLGNCHASGTEIIQRLGAEQLRARVPRHGRARLRTHRQSPRLHRAAAGTDAARRGRGKRCRGDWHRQDF